MKLNVHLKNPPEPECQCVLESLLQAGIRLTTGEQLPSPADYHILVAGRPDQRELTSSPNLHTLVIPFAGLPDETRELMQGFPEIAVHNLHHNAAPTAEMALALLLAAAKFLLPFDRSLRQSDWRPRYQTNPSLLLEGRTVLILGYGHIGQRVAQVCQTLGMKVLAVQRQDDSETPQEAGTSVHPVQDLPDLLPRTDVLIITLPGTSETTGMIGARELALMPPGGLLVNVGRGPVVDQQALFQALESGQLHAAGLDVWYNYPKNPDARADTPPADLPFHQLDNVVMSPHRGNDSDRTEQLRMTQLAHLLNSAARGEPLPNRVDLQAGY
jgi:phosphoglycerate dehydrogenase-like enzyme